MLCPICAFGIKPAISVGMCVIVAIAVYEDGVSTTFDFAGELLVVELEGGHETARRGLPMEGLSPVAKAELVADSGAATLVCGAVSRQLMRHLAWSGLRVMPFVTGAVDDVLAAYLCGRLAEPDFLQAGCRPGVRRRWRHGAGCRRGCGNNYQKEV
jgi:predicted Fe-Mo cluster-binding NifX family protein